MSSIAAITVPKWGLTMTEGTMTEWLVQEGDTIAKGDAVADMETSKIVNTVESNVAGTLRRIVAQPGETLEIAMLLAVVSSPEVSEDEINHFIETFTPESVAQTNVMSKTEDSPESNDENISSSDEPNVSTLNESPLTSTLSEGNDDSTIPASSHARRIAGKHNVNLHNVAATGRHDKVTKQDVINALNKAGITFTEQRQTGVQNNNFPKIEKDDVNVKATAVARRIAKEHSINLHNCQPSGSRGRVCKQDVEAQLALRNRSITSPTAPTADIVTTSTPTNATFEEVKLGGMRKTIARRLKESKLNAPHYRLEVECNIENLLKLRKQMNEDIPSIKLSVNDFITKATATALLRSPDVNVQFDGETIKKFRSVDISIAVALKDGLITPIIKSADSLSIGEISTSIRDLATRAKVNNLKADEISGGTFCISNLGMFGINKFDAIINPPQSGILAVGQAEKRPVVINNEIVPMTMMTITASFDHRIIDGAVGSAFLGLIKKYIEHPALMLA
jgi:pyruvate dehydrogenase E2 component (dihydrolipoyllysine-residue acetyltransferase)